MEKTDWLQKNPLGKYIVEKKINHEPLIRRTLLDYIRDMEDIDDR